MRKILLLIIVLTYTVKNKTIAQTWSTLDSGIGSAYYHSVYSSAIYQGELYVGGSFSTAGNVTANNIAKWNGTNWSSPGTGVNGYISSLCVFNGELYAGGNFSTAGNTAANHIARWNGTNWTDAGAPNCNLIKALMVYNGELYAAGNFSFPDLQYGTSIAKWNGFNWTAAGPETDFYIIDIECMEIYNGELFAAGAYYQIGGGGVPNYYRILKWNGLNWSIVLEIPANYTLDGALGDIFTMKSYNGELYVAGTSQIARWNGINWSSVGMGINFESYPYGDGSDGSAYSFVKSLEVFNGALYATGRFPSCGDVATSNIAKWDGTSWSALGQGINGYGYNLLATDTSLIVGGWFNSVDGTNLPASKIAQWTEPCSAVPAQPGNIFGPNSICQNTSHTYTINQISGAVNYTWILPAGWTGFSSNNSITVTANTNGGSISVMANNNCGSSMPQTFEITVKDDTLLSIPGMINGNFITCNNSSQVYTIDPVPGAINYSWSIPPGWTSDTATNSVSVITGENSGTISVTVNNNCGSSIPVILPITVLLPPPIPEYIDGNDRVCSGSSSFFSVPPVPGATDYTWVLPDSWLGNSDTVFITANVGNTSGDILVRASNHCGNSLFQILPVFVNSLPVRPGIITGNIYTKTNFSNLYSIEPLPGIRSYQWSIDNSVIGGSGMNYLWTSWEKPGEHELSVQAINDCGKSEAQKLKIKVSEPDPENPFDLKFFPNPSTGEFFLKAKRIQDKTISVDIINMIGQAVYHSGQMTGTNDYTQLFDISKMVQGLYVVRVAVDDKMYVRKIVKVQ